MFECATHTGIVRRARDRLRFVRDNLWRFRRTLAQARDLYIQHGSAKRSARYVVRYTRKKLPLLREHYRMSRQSGQVAGAITERLDQDGPELRIAIRLTGGIGDYVIIARFLRDLAAVTEGFRFDVYCTQIETAKWVFSSTPSFGQCYSEFLFDKLRAVYPLALRVSQFVVVHAEEADWQRLRGMPRLLSRIEAIIKFRPKIETFIQHHPFMDGFLGQKIVFMNMNRNNFLHGMAGIAYSGERFPLATTPATLARFGLAGRRYVTLHNGFDTGFIISGNQATKCYPHFAALAARIKAEIPDVCLVQLGASTSVPIATVDIQLIDKTALPEVAELLRGASLHIDNEGGLVHLASCLGTRSCVIFGPTSADYFAYAENINIRPQQCGGCWWINDTWMDQCPRGFAQPICLSEQTPEQVMEAIRPYLTERFAPVARMA